MQKISKEINRPEYKGKFRAYKYRHIPSYHMRIIDGAKPYGKIYVSHYLYGKKRAASPTLEIYRQREFELYQLYWESYKALTDQAVLFTKE